MCFPDDGGQCRTGSWHRRLNVEQLYEDLAMLPALVTAALQQDHPSLVGSSESVLPVTCLLFKGDMENLGMSITIGSVSLDLFCDLFRI